jgi:arsenate reductase
MTTTIYHNPNCSTSRQVLERLKEAGRAPEVVEYLKTGWTEAQLKTLMRQAGLSARELLRTRGDKAAEAGLTDASSEAEILKAMVKEPVLVERPIVVTEKGAVLARPKEKVEEIL